MSEETYQILFRGKIVRGHEVSQVKSYFSKLFKLPAEKVEQLFDGKQRVLKKSLSLEQADAFRSKLKKYGIRVSLQQNKVESVTSADTMTLSAPGVVLVPPIPKPDIHIETSHLQFNEAEGPIVEKQFFEEPDVDLSELTLDEPGEMIVEKNTVPEPDIDVSDIAVDEPGAIIVERVIVPEPDISTDDMVLDPIDTLIVEPYHNKKAEYDTEHIKLEDILEPAERAE